MPIKNIANQRFGRLTVVVATKKRSSNRNVIWLCRCDCGNLTEVRRDSLLSGRIKSCGCLHEEKIRAGNPKHGGWGARLYRIWRGMKERCRNPRGRDYCRYGGRGIIVCDEWNKDYIAFQEWALSHGYTSGLTIDRINNDGNYEPSNCQWITKSENTEKVVEDRLQKQIDYYVDGYIDAVNCIKNTGTA